MTLPPGTVSCMLCRGVVAYRNGDATRFTNHMNHEHGAYFDHEFLLAACLMNEEERDAVRSVMAAKTASHQTSSSSSSSPDTTPVPQISSPRTIEGLEEDNIIKTPQSKRKRPEKEVVEDDAEKPLAVKAESISDVIEAGSDKKVMFECEECHRSYSSRKSLLCHYTKMGHGPKSKTSSPGIPTPARSATPPPASSPSVSSSSSTFFDALQKSWKSVIEDAGSKTAKTKDSTSVEYAIKHEDLVSKVATLDEEAEDTPDTNDDNEDPDDPGYPDTQNKESEPMETETDETAEEESDPLAELPKKDVEVEANVEKSKYFKANPHTFSLPTDKEQGMSVEEFTTEDQKMPKGWKIKEVTRVLKNGRRETKRFFLTRDHHILKTGLAVLEFMRLTGAFTAKQIMDIARHLSVPVSRLEKYMELYL